MKLDLTNTDGKKITVDSETVVTVNDVGAHRVIVYRTTHTVLVKDKATAINKLMHGLELAPQDKGFTNLKDLGE